MLKIDDSDRKSAARRGRKDEKCIELTAASMRSKNISNDSTFLRFGSTIMNSLNSRSYCPTWSFISKFKYVSLVRLFFSPKNHIIKQILVYEMLEVSISKISSHFTSWLRDESIFTQTKPCLSNHVGWVDDSRSSTFQGEGNHVRFALRGHTHMTSARARRGVPMKQTKVTEVS